MARRLGLMLEARNSRDCLTLLSLLRNEISTIAFNGSFLVDTRMATELLEEITMFVASETI